VIASMPHCGGYEATAAWIGGEGRRKPGEWYMVSFVERFRQLGVGASALRWKKNKSNGLIS
jgi:hypothetical protein